MSLSDIDRKLLETCLAGQPGAWEDFVDRFLGLVLHVINHTAQSRSVELSSHDREDLAGDVFLEIVKNDYALLRRFRGKAALTTYLTVVSRRIVVHRIKQGVAAPRNTSTPAADEKSHDPVERISNRDEVERLLKGLNGPEADVVRLYHLEGRSYREISSTVGIAENSVGPTLSRAREKMRHPGR